MEYLLLGGLAYAGQQYAKQSKLLPKNAPLGQNPREGLKPTPNSTPLTVSDIHTSFASQMERHLENPNTVNETEPLANHNMPFFKSERSQNTNDALKDRRLSTFTGVNSTDFRHKREVEAPKPTRDLTNVNGSRAQVDQQRYEPLVNLKNNELPFEQVKVGPGLGLKPDDVATGGFHQNVRVLPGNVNGYRRNNFEGRTISGKATVDQSEMKTDVDVNRRTPLHESFRGLDVKQSSVHGARVRSSEVFRNTRRDTDLNVLANTSGVAGPYVPENATRQHSSLTPSNYVGNAQSERLGQPSKSTYMMHSTERGDPNTQMLNVSGARGTYRSVSNFDDSTQREMATCGPVNKASVSINAPTTVRDGYDAKPTQKLLTGDYIGGASRTVGSYVDNMNVNPTLRGTHNEDMLSGPSAASVSANASYNHAYDGSRQVTIREDTLVSDYFPNFNGQNQLKDPSEANIRYRNEPRPNQNLYMSLIPNGLNIPSEIGLQRSNRTDGTNQRDFGFTPSILASNDLAIDMTKQFDK